MPRPSTLCLVGAALLIGCQGENVVRVFNGREVSGRYVSPESYATFAIATLEEAKGNRRAAVEAYEREIQEDTQNAGAWGRLGAIQCTTSPHDADRAFARAEAIEPDLESPWAARAACALERNDAERAVTYAKNAILLSPDDPEANRLVIAALEKRGDRTEAERWRRGFALGSASDSEGRSPPRPDGPADALARAIDGADVEQAERAAVHARIGSAELSLRAVKRGRLDLAETVATRVLEADPSNSDARIASLATADIGGNGAAFAKALGAVPRGSSLPTPLAAELLEAVIHRRIGPDAARAFRESYESAKRP